MSNGSDLKNDYLPDLLPFGKKTPSKNTKKPIDDSDKEKIEESIKPMKIEDSKSKEMSKNIKSQIKESSSHNKK